MNTEQARELYQDYLVTIFTEKKVDQLDRFYAADIVGNPPIPGLDHGLDGIKAFFRSFLGSFSDVRYTIHAFVFDPEQQLFAARISATAVHSGDFAGIPATGRQIEFGGHPFYRLRDGKIAEYWDNSDVLERLRGAVASPAS